MRVAIYTRVSTADQSTDMQLSSLREYANSRNWEIVKEVEEVASGAKDNRPRRQEIIDQAKKRRLDVVLVWKLDRWGRNLSDLIVTLDEFKAVGVSFVSANEAFDLSTPIGKAFMGLLAVMADFERNIIRDRIKAGVSRYREKNKVWGRPATARKFAPLIKHLSSQGKSVGDIVKESGVSRSSVMRVLKN